MDLKETIRRILKGVAKKLSNKLHCDRHGSCVHFAELFVEEINNTHPELLKEFEVIEGYVDVKFGEGKPQEHTWIRLSDDEVIDPTFMQFTKYDKNAKYSRKRTKSYTGQEYYDKGVIESWFSKRREEQPDTVFKGGLKESIRRILREETKIPLEDLNTVIKDLEGGFDVFIMNGDKKIGEISFTEEDKPNQYTISDATIDDEYKGNRIYPKTIINLFKEKPNIIINSVFRSPEAQKAWIYLLSNLPPNIGKSVKYYKDEDTTLFQLKSRNLQESIRRILREEITSREVEVRPEVFYSFANLPNKHWISDKDIMYPEEFFDDKNFEEYQFDNFLDMDQMFGHKNSPFGTKGLEVGDPNRTSRSFDRYNYRFGPAIVRVIPNKIKMETTESELTERCWKGYTQKGMKTMFGKQYPNCVKIKKK